PRHPRAGHRHVTMFPRLTPGPLVKADPRPRVARPNPRALHLNPAIVVKQLDSTPRHQLQRVIVKSFIHRRDAPLHVPPVQKDQVRMHGHIMQKTGSQIHAQLIGQGLYSASRMKNCSQIEGDTLMSITATMPVVKPMKITDSEVTFYNEEGYLPLPGLVDAA